MTLSVKLKAGDTYRIEKQLLEDGDPVDLTNETVQAYVQFDEDNKQLVANQEVEYADRTEGRVAITLDGTQTANIGRHRMEWVVDPTGTTESYPRDGYDRLNTISPLDRDLATDTEVPPDLEVTNLSVEGQVDMRGNDILNAGSVSAGELNTENSSTVVTLSEDQTCPHETETLVEFDTTKLNQIGFDTSSHKFISQDKQTISISFKAQFRTSLEDVRVAAKINNSTAMTAVNLDGLAPYVGINSHTEEFALNEGDEVTLTVRGETSDGSSFDIQSTGGRSTLLRIRRV